MVAERRLIHYRGQVQGVGFRYTTHRIANGYDLTGYVRNLRDGRVELLAEGDSEQLDSFLEEIRMRQAGRITQETATQTDPTGQFRTFEIQPDGP